MEKYLKFCNGKNTYLCSEDTFRVFITKNETKEICNASISDVEILYYRPVNEQGNGSIIVVSPDMESGLQCLSNKDPDQNISKLYSYLIEHGASERHLGSFKAIFAKHSATEEKEALAKKSQKEQKRKERIENNANKALAHAKEIEKEKLHKGCKVKTEEQYRCSRCNNKWYVSNFEQLRTLANVLNGSVYSLNQVKEPNKCPKCGSVATSHKTVKIWIDKKGNAVDCED